MNFLKTAVFSLLFVFSQLSFANTPKIPEYNSFVNESSVVFSTDEISTIKNLVSTLKNKNQVDMSILVMNSTTPLTIEQYSIKLAEKWKNGVKGKDRGIILLVAIEDHAARLEVGYGLEGVITDLEAKAILDDYVLPYFKVKNYSNGINNAIVKVGNLSSENKIALDQSNPNFNHTATKANIDTIDPEKEKMIKTFLALGVWAFIISIIVRIVIVDSLGVFVAGIASTSVTMTTVGAYSLLFSTLNYGYILLSGIIAFIVGIVGPQIIFDILSILVNIKGGASSSSSRSGGFGGGGSSSKW